MLHYSTIRATCVATAQRDCETSFKPFSLLQPLTAFAEVRYGKRDFAKIEGRKTEKGKVGRDAEGEVGG